MNNPNWCVIFAINDKVQNFITCYSLTENAVYEPPDCKVKYFY